MLFTSSDDKNIAGHTANKRSNAESRSSTDVRSYVGSVSTTRTPQPIFAFMMPPKVSSIARDELVERLKLRKGYEEIMKEQCKCGEEDIGTVMKSVKNSFDEYLLETLSKVSWGVTVEAVTDDFLLEHIYAITNSYQNQVLPPPVNALFQKALRMDENYGHHVACGQLLHVLQHTNQERRRLAAFTVEGLITSVDASSQPRKAVIDMFTPRGTGKAVSIPRGLAKTQGFLPMSTLSLVLEDASTVDVCADSGADRSEMSMEIYERFGKACPAAVKVVRLEKPLACKGADDKSIEVKMIVNLHLKLTTAARSVRIAKPDECLVIPDDSMEFLLGNDVFSLLGIAVPRQLDLLVGITIRDEQADEFDDIHEPQVGSSAGLDTELLTVVGNRIENAVRKGLPNESVPRLRKIATQYAIWGLRLGDYPPARVLPMKIRLKPGAKPYRCKLRKYPPEARKFLDEFNDEQVRLS
ncbi:unnamed protein product [Phytophthora fragariaefolia]|uniref:Unnamed protein product n=1 Tax=Phytophthora fragariaefolia TaxID=1490495 RepID=A0A9W7CQL1_9STRA|nr:unnamed protein product [Phytophthora fragariaefolia]